MVLTVPSSSADPWLSLLFCFSIVAIIVFSVYVRFVIERIMERHIKKRLAELSTLVSNDTQYSSDITKRYEHKSFNEMICIAKEDDVSRKVALQFIQERLQVHNEESDDIGVICDFAHAIELTKGKQIPVHPIENFKCSLLGIIAEELGTVSSN